MNAYRREEQNRRNALKAKSYDQLERELDKLRLEVAAYQRTAQRMQHLLMSDQLSEGEAAGFRRYNKEFLNAWREMVDDHS